MSPSDRRFLESYYVPARLDTLGESRSRLTKWLSRIGPVDEERCDCMRLVLVELLANAIEASSTESVVTYEFTLANGEMAMRVANLNMTGSPIELRSMPRATATDGRGLALAQEYAERVDITAAGDSVDITAFFRR